MKIQERDRQVLVLCYEQQFLVTEHLFGSFFKGATKERKARLRVQELIEAGFLQRQENPLTGKSSILRLTKLGKSIAETSATAKVPQLRRITPSKILHDERVTSVRLRLQEIWDGTWIPEAAIKKYEFSEIPDGIVSFESGKKIAIEIENSLKGKERFVRRLKAWDGVPVKMVFFIASNPAIEKTLRRYLNEAPSRPFFGLTTWEELKNGTPSLWSPNGPINAFSKREL